MSTTILDPNGNEVEVFVALSGGVLDLAVRADSPEAFTAAAIASKLMVTDEDGAVHLAAGVNIDVIGPVVLTRAVVDADGNVTTPAVMDNRYHANIRITEPALSAATNGYPNWQATAIAWTQNGVADTPNASEAAVKLSGVALIDPPTISSPSRVWL